MTLPLMHAARCAAMLIAGITLAGPTLAIDDWNLPAATGVPDEASVAVLALNLPYVTLSSAVQTGTHTIRYGLPATECFGCEFVYPVLGARLLDAGTGSRVRISLRRYDRISGTSATMVAVDSDASANTSGYVNREAEGRNLVFDFSRNSYWIEAELTRSTAGAPAPALSALWLRWAPF